MRNVTSLNARRNGLSVISVNGLLVEGSSFSGAAGTSPEYGVDFEPNRPTQQLTGIVFQHNTFSNNRLGCIAWTHYTFDGTTAPVSATISDTRCEQTGPFPAVHLIGPKVTDAGGTLVFSDLFIEHRQWAGSSSVAVTHMQPSGTQVTFQQTTVWNVGGRSTDLGYADADQPMPSYLLESGRLGNQQDVVPTFGGTHFVDNVVVSDLSMPFLAVYKPDQWPSGVSGLQGNFTVFNPMAAGRSTALGDRATGNSITVNAVVTTPPPSVSLADSTTVGTCGLRFVVSRTSADLSFPLAVPYTVGGSMEQRQKLDGVSGVVTIPAGQTSAPIDLTLRTPEGPLQGRAVTVRIDPSLPGEGLNAEPGYAWLGKGSVRHRR